MQYALLAAGMVNPADQTNHRRTMTGECVEGKRSPVGVNANYIRQPRICSLAGSERCR